LEGRFIRDIARGMGVYTGVDVGRFGGRDVVDRSLRDINSAKRRRN
jgi:hypothetical protein